LDRVVQIVGGHGDPSVQVQANRLTGELAAVTGARPVFLPAPGLVGSPALRRALVKDASIGDAMKSWKELDLALVGIGSLEPSPLLRQSGNALTEAEQDQLRNVGAVGDVCLRFFDVNGDTVKTSLDERVMSITPADLMQVPRRVGVAGGASKRRAIRAALLGGWVNVIITDLDTARGLVEDADGPLTSEYDLQPAIDPKRFGSCQVSRWNRCASSTTATRSGHVLDTALGPRSGGGMTVDAAAPDGRARHSRRKLVPARLEPLSARYGT
jgi:hypothetical protein